MKLLESLIQRLAVAETVSQSDVMTTQKTTKRADNTDIPVTQNRKVVGISTAMQDRRVVRDLELD